MKYVFGWLLLATQSLFAAEIGEFSHHKAKTPGTTLGVMDLSDYSLKWLNQNRDYLVKNKVLVLVLDASEIEVNQLIDRTGVLAGTVPEPTHLVDKLFETLGLMYYPAVIEDTIIWQVNPNLYGVKK